MGVTVPSGLVWNSDTLPVEALAANTNVLCWGVAPPLPGEVPGVAMGIFDSPWQPAIKNNKKNVKTSRQRVTNDDFISSEPGEGEVLVVKSEEINSRTGWLSKVKFDEVKSGFSRTTEVEEYQAEMRRRALDITSNRYCSIETRLLLP